MSADSDDLEFELRSVPNRLRLTSWPPRDGGWACWLLPPAVVAVCLVVGRSTDWGLAALVGAAQALALWRWFLPAAFELNELGVHQRIIGRRRRIPWSAIADYRILRRGVLLLPDAQQRPLDALRGLYLPWRKSRFEMLGLLEKHLHTRAAAHGRGANE